MFLHVLIVDLQVKRMETLVLRVIGFDMGLPTRLDFLEHYSQMFQLDNSTLHLAMVNVPALTVKVVLF